MSILTNMYRENSYWIELFSKTDNSNNLVMPPCHILPCLVVRRLKCEKRKTLLNEPSRSIAQWTLGTFSVDTKDAGKEEREK